MKLFINFETQSIPSICMNSSVLSCRLASISFPPPLLATNASISSKKMTDGAKWRAKPKRQRMIFWLSPRGSEILSFVRFGLKFHEIS